MKEIKKYFESRAGKYSFYFEDISSGYVYGYNENVPMIAAGCIKLPIALALLKEVERGIYTLEDKHYINESDKVFGTGIIYELGEREYTLRELLAAMVIQSDNTASNKIISLLGMKKINNNFKELGLKNTSLNSKTSDVSKDQEENISTSYDLSLCWKALSNNTYLSKENSEELIKLLSRQQLKSKSTLYIAEDLKSYISNKTGDKPSIENDTMLIRLQKGNFTFTVMSSEIPNSVYGLVTLAKAGKMMWDSINNLWI